MNAPTASKPAPLKLVHFLSEMLIDLPVRGRVVSVQVGEASYLVTVALAEGGQAVSQFSVWEVSRGMRGDPAARAAIREGFQRSRPQDQ